MLSADFLKRYDFDWEIMDVVIGGRSAVDSRNALRLPSISEAEQFLDCYGYNSENPIEKAELFGNFQEALSFIRRTFLKPDNPDGIRGEIPKKITEVTDIGQLLIIASSNNAELSRWACSVIKVMHTISHMDKDLRTHYFTDIQTQILDRVYKYVHSENEQVYLGRDIRDPDRVDLVLFDSKPKKKRDSVLLKLLHKPENVAEDIFDRVGIRFVTKNKYDGLRVIKFLKERYVIMPANIKPSRSRNTLVNVPEFQRELDRLLSEAATQKWSASDMDRRLIEFCESPAAIPESAKRDSENAYSSQYYRSIQFTARQLIKFRNTLYDDVRELKNLVKTSTVPEEVAKITERLDLRNIQKEIRFFYPFEVQVYDEVSAGMSAHSAYKKAQIQAAMRRVMGELAERESTPHA